MVRRFHMLHPNEDPFGGVIFSALVEEYRSISDYNIGNGSSVLLWKDFWSNGELLCDKYPGLLSYALNEDILVASFASMQDVGFYFGLPLSMEAYQEFQEMPSFMEAAPLDNGIIDTRRFVWGDKLH
jgi:hypothetical protein